MFCCTSCCKWYVGNNIRSEQFQGEERDMFLQSMKPELDGMRGWYKVQGLLASESWWGSFSLVYYWTVKRLWKNDRFHKTWIQAFSFDTYDENIFLFSLDMEGVTSLVILLKQWQVVSTRQTNWKWQVDRTVFSLVEKLTFLFKSCQGF